MKNEINEHTNLKENKKENMNGNQKNQNINKIMESKINSKYFTIKTILISFIVLTVIIYFITIFIIHKSEIPMRNLTILNKEKLNKTETLLLQLKPNPSYKGPIFPDDGKITKEWIFELIEYMKDWKYEKSIEEKFLSKYDLLKMISKAKSTVTEYDEAIIDLNIPKDKNFTVVGDIHGQFYDLLNLFEINGYPSEDNIYLFNGDFVDRGNFQIETITTLMAFKILYPNHFFMNRGNHEDVDTNSRYGFKTEIVCAYGIDVFDCFSEFFRFLPLGHVLDKKVLVIHGGLFSRENVTINELKKIDRYIDVPHTGIMSELLWSDPRDESGWRPSDRGIGVFFGPDITDKFLNDNNLEFIIRSHEVKMEGYEIQHGGKLITLFSAPNYDDYYKNKGAIIKFMDGKIEPNFIQYDAVPHP